MKLSGGQNYRSVRYTQSLAAVGVPFISEVEEHFHRPCARHDHHETQLLLILDGAMRIWADDHDITIRAGQACAIPPRLLHYVGAGDEASVRAVYLDIRFAESAGPLHRFLVGGNHLQVRPGRLSHVRQSAKRLADTIRTEGPARTADAVATIWLLVAEFAGEASAAADTETPIDRRLLAAERLMKDQLAREISVDDLAAVTGLSRSQLSRLYAKVFQQSPAARLRQLRIEQADHLLKHSTLSVKEVSHVCGFACPNHFARVYQDFTGMTPSAGRAG